MTPLINLSLVKVLMIKFSLLEVACDCVRLSLEQRPKMIDIYKTIGAMWEGYRSMFDSEKRMKLSTVCPDQITHSNEIECIC